MEAVLRDLVWRRADSRCEYCRMPQDLDPLTFEVEHVIPQKHHGLTVESNLALAFSCRTLRAFDRRDAPRDERL